MVIPTVDFETEWRTVQAGIDKVVSLVAAGCPNNRDISGELVMNVHHAVYQLCVCWYRVDNGTTYEEELYRRYKEFFENYIDAETLPNVRNEAGDILLGEVVKRWQDYKFIAHWMSRFFQYLEIRFTYHHRTPTMLKTAMLILENKVYTVMKEEIIDTVLSLIEEDREGKSVDRVLIKEVLETVYEYDIQSEELSSQYQTDFVHVLLEKSFSYYYIKVCSEKQSLVQCMNAERLRAEQYLHPSTLTMLLTSLQSKLANSVESIICGKRKGMLSEDNEEHLKASFMAKEKEC